MGTTGGLNMVGLVFIDEHIKYQEGFKYQLFDDFTIKIPIIGYDIEHSFIRLSPDGFLVIHRGFAWDGPSGPTFDDKTNLRSSLVHDVIYELIRHRLLPLIYKHTADEIFHVICKKDKMPWWRAAYYLLAVTLRGYKFVKREKDRYLIAP